jgi:glycerate kinase
LLIGSLNDVTHLDLSGLDPRLAQIELRVACDVTNPLLGSQGAAAVYGPQKGAWPEDVAALEAWLSRYADLLETASGVRARDRAGAGAAGGTGFALMCLTPRLRSFDLIPGVELVMQETGFDEHLAHADLVLTGEGQVDAQTAFGKTALGVARRAAAASIPCLAVGGRVTREGAAVMVAEGAVAVPVLDRPMTLGEAMNEVSSLVISAGERLARMVEIGAAVALRSSRS